MDRKELVRQYRDTPRTTGVGVVRHTATGKTFLLAGNDIQALLNRTRAQLSSGGFPYGELQRDWKAAGPDGFAFEVLDTLPTPTETDFDPTVDLKLLEAMWLEKLEPYPPTGYNRRRKVS